MTREQADLKFGFRRIELSHTLDDVRASPQLLVFSHPARALGLVLQRGEIQDPLAWLASWEARSANIVAAVEARDGDALLVVDEATAQFHADTLVSLCMHRFDFPLRIADLAPDQTIVDPLVDLLAIELTRRSTQVASLYARLMDLRSPLDTHAAASPRGLAHQDVTDAIASYLRLRTQREQARDTSSTAIEGDPTLLNLRLEHALGELRACREQLDACTDRLASASYAGWPHAPRVARMAVTQQRDTVPYRELSLVVRTTEANGTDSGEMAIRLVEHRGHPGLVIFDAADGAPPFERWNPSGMEDGRGYMLLIPLAPEAKARFDGMSTRDWLLVLSISTALEHFLAATTGMASWLTVARRLRVQLLERPLSVHTGHVELEDAGNTIIVRAKDVMYGPRRVPELVLAWSLTPPAGRLQLLDGAPGATDWMQSMAAGDAQTGSGVPIPAGDAPGHTPAWAAWWRLSDGDRNFLTRLVAAWPTIVNSAVDRARVEPARARVLADAALALAAAIADATVHPGTGATAQPGGPLSEVRDWLRRLLR